VVQEAFINGVSTRKIERLARALGIETMSASQVSEINKGLTQEVEAFRNRVPAKYRQFERHGIDIAAGIENDRTAPMILPDYRFKVG